jgi:uncharacterized protein
MKVSGRHVLVTGASRGIGAATARALASRGASISLVARDAAALQDVADDIQRAGGRAQFCAANLADFVAAERGLSALAAEAGWPDVVVHSAGAGRWLFTEETSPAEAVEMMGAPYFAAFYVSRLCLPAMLGRKRGHLVFVNSPVARGAWPGAAGYTAARYALQGLTNALRLDLRGTGIGVTSVVPARVSSAYFERNPGVEARLPRIGRLIPTLTPEQVGRAIVRAIERNQAEIVMPGMLRLTFVVNAVAPWLVRWLIVRTGWHRGD